MSVFVPRHRAMLATGVTANGRYLVSEQTGSYRNVFMSNTHGNVFRQGYQLIWRDDLGVTTTVFTGFMTKNQVNPWPPVLESAKSERQTVRWLATL